MSFRYIFGVATIVTIVGGTVWAIKKSKDRNKTEEEAISVQEARDEIAAWRKFKKMDVVEDVYAGVDTDGDIYFEKGNITEVDLDFDGNVIQQQEDIEEELEKLRRDVDENKMSFKEYEEEEYVEEEEESEVYEEQEYEEEKRGSDLRYEPNSYDARKQYIKMELADWSPKDDMYQTLEKLFEFPFIPQNDGDYDLKHNIIDYRIQFFGFGSKWSQEVTFAEVILHYARLATYNCDETVKYWVEYFMEFNELHHTVPSHTIDKTLVVLNKHVYYNDQMGTYGIFGLSRESLNDAMKIANKNIDRAITYEIEFNEFLKSCV